MFLPRMRMPTILNAVQFIGLLFFFAHIFPSPDFRFSLAEKANSTQYLYLNEINTRFCNNDPFRCGKKRHRYSQGKEMSALRRARKTPRVVVALV